MPIEKLSFSTYLKKIFLRTLTADSTDHMAVMIDKSLSQIKSEVQGNLDLLKRAIDDVGDSEAIGTTFKALIFLDCHLQGSNENFFFILPEKRYSSFKTRLTEILKTVKNDAKRGKKFDVWDVTYGGKEGDQYILGVTPSHDKMKVKEKALKWLNKAWAKPKKFLFKLASEINTANNEATTDVAQGSVSRFFALEQELANKITDQSILNPSAKLLEGFLRRLGDMSDFLEDIKINHPDSATECADALEYWQTKYAEANLNAHPLTQQFNTTAEDLSYTFPDDVLEGIAERQLKLFGLRLKTLNALVKKMNDEGLAPIDKQQAILDEWLQKFEAAKAAFLRTKVSGNQNPTEEKLKETLDELYKRAVSLNKNRIPVAKIRDYLFESMSEAQKVRSNPKYKSLLADEEKEYKERFKIIEAVFAKVLNNADYGVGVELEAMLMRPQDQMLGELKQELTAAFYQFEQEGFDAPTFGIIANTVIPSIVAKINDFQTNVYNQSQLMYEGFRLLRMKKEEKKELKLDLSQKLTALRSLATQAKGTLEELRVAGQEAQAMEDLAKNYAQENPARKQQIESEIRMKLTNYDAIVQQVQTLFA